MNHCIATTFHPQTNGQAKVSNREIKCILEKVVCPSRKYWSLKLDETVWAYRTTYKTPLGMSPFQLVYGKGCHLLVEIEQKAYWALTKLNLDLDAAGKKMMLLLNELDEFQLQSYEKNKMYKEKVKSGTIELKSRWSGPFVVKTLFPHGAVEIFENDLGQAFKVNGQRLKHYYGDMANREVKISGPTSEVEHARVDLARSRAGIPETKHARADLAHGRADLAEGERARAGLARGRDGQQLQQSNEKSELEELRVMCKSQAVSIKTLENQIGQIVNALLNRQPGTLSSDTEVPGKKEAKEQVKAITLRSEKVASQEKAQVPESEDVAE
ncbi:hypothetical protein AgCh_012524 [Apium graveolens]